jgi:hypothetical protein
MNTGGCRDILVSSRGGNERITAPATAAAYLSWAWRPPPLSLARSPRSSLSSRAPASSLDHSALLRSGRSSSPAVNALRDAALEAETHQPH